jgi:hypothetical protein
VHGEAADVTSGKEQRMDDEGIGGQGEPPEALGLQHRLVLERVETLVAQFGQEHVADQRLTQPAPTPVAQHDRVITAARQSAAPKRFCSLLRRRALGRQEALIPGRARAHDALRSTALFAIGKRRPPAAPRPCA